MQLQMLDMMENSQSSGKTSPASSPTKETHLDVSWQDLSEQMIPYYHQKAEAGPVLAWFPGHGHGSHGGFSMLNTSECHNAAAASFLSQILETAPIPQRFFLSAKACQGFLSRSDGRERALPHLLRVALENTAKGSERLGNPAGTLGGGSETLIVFGWQNSEHQGDSMSETTSPTLDKSKVPAVFIHPLRVRRLTPRECERLQGFPDNHTDIPGAKDTPRYKAIGNSMAVPVMRWLLTRLQASIDQHTAR